MSIEVPSGRPEPFTLTGRRQTPPPPPIPPPAEPAPAGSWWDRESLVGLAASLSFHGLLLLILACWWFAPATNVARRFDTSLEAGSPFGDESGDQLQGALGLDAPLSLPSAAESTAPPTITALPPPDANIGPSLPKPPAAADGGASAGLGTGSGLGAGNGDGFGVARFGRGGETINGVQVKVGDPQFTLIWDAKVDLDLHVLEPGGSEIFWESPVGARGGELDVDDIDGYGPENVNYGGGEGRGPAGAYKWFVKYFGAEDGISRATRWKVRVKHDGVVNVYTGGFKRIGESSKVYTLTLDPAGGRPAGDAARDEP